jgi:hypothetical protein
VCSTNLLAAMRRYTIEEKKNYLRMFSASKSVTQKMFCEKHSLGQSMFSKWRRQESEIMQTVDHRKNRDRNLDVSDCKYLLHQYLVGLDTSGQRLDVVQVLQAAEMVCPQLFATVKNYNGRYVMCARLRREFFPEPPCIRLFEDNGFVNQSCRTTSNSDVPGHVFAAYTSVEINVFIECEEDDVRFVDDTIECVCQGTG